MPIIQYLLVTIVLFAGILLYFRIADKYNIIDKPNDRSSHNYITFRGGGIVFFLAGLIYSTFHLPESLFFLVGIALISGISFWDDVSSLPNKARLVVQFLSIALVFYGLGLFSLLSWWLIFIACIFFTGVLNAYNFMDGINGITGLYSLAVLLSLRYVNSLIEYTNAAFIDYAMLACIVFLFFNYRKKAKCFAGDIGSIAISFWIVTLLLQLMVATGSLVWILFLAVYGVDSIATILHRLRLKQNIFEAHRLHFYQILSNERGISHLIVSAVYALVQLLICGIMSYTYFNCSPVFMWITGAVVLIILGIVYLQKFRLMKSQKVVQA